MRTLTIAALAIGLAACSNEPKATEQQLQEFEPPVVGVRGDVVPRADARFERLDRNKDGAITPDEFPARFADRLSAQDTDKNGKVSQSEMVESALRRFDALDTNKDGQVTPEERRAADPAR